MRKRLYYSGWDGDDVSVTADEVVIEEQSPDTGLLDACGNPIRRERRSVGFRIGER